VYVLNRLSKYKVKVNMDICTAHLNTNSIFQKRLDMATHSFI